MDFRLLVRRDGTADDAVPHCRLHAPHLTVFRERALASQGP